VSYCSFSRRLDRTKLKTMDREEHTSSSFLRFLPSPPSLPCLGRRDPFSARAFVDPHHGDTNRPGGITNGGAEVDLVGLGREGGREGGVVTYLDELPGLAIVHHLQQISADPVRDLLAREVEEKMRNGLALPPTFPPPLHVSLLRHERPSLPPSLPTCLDLHSLKRGRM